MVEEYAVPDSKILDIGRSPLTSLLYKRGYKNLTTLGFPLSKTHLDKIIKVPKEVQHIVFDLNDSKDPEKWVKLPKFDMIIFAEVLEHLHVAPEYVMEFLKSGLNDEGYIILQTPNAVSIGKRIKMLFGLHPYEQIRRGDDPGHIREYTKKELIELGEKCGLKINARI
ncbi:methyltransferase domain-containing protein [Methanothermobacter tenebrarum]